VSNHPETDDSAITSDLRALLVEYSSPHACAVDLLCDRHRGDAVAFTVVAEDLTCTDLTYAELRDQSTRLAAALADLGIGRGDKVATLMGKSADLLVVLLAIWRLGAVHVPMFTAFAPAAIQFRLRQSRAKFIVTDADQRHKLARCADPAAPWRVIVAGTSSSDLSLSTLLALYTDPWSNTTPVAIGADGQMVELYTSGTTGTPKAVPVPLRALASFVIYLDVGLDVSANDVYWNIADPGWAYGLYYAVMAPMAAGRRSLLLQAGFSAHRTWQVLDQLGVTNFAAAPTVYRALRAEDHHRPPALRLRRASSAGEPLTPDVPAWSTGALGVPVRDHYGQSEHGMLIANAWSPAAECEARAGSMGKSLPGFRAAVIGEDNDEVLEPGQLGRIAIDAHQSPAMWFTGYRDDTEKTAERFVGEGRWYLTGDAGSVDQDGYFYFSARDDDVIIMAGYRIGPFDVESVLASHHAVSEAAVVGAPDKLRGEVLEAYVVLASGVEPSAELAVELQTAVKEKYAAHAYPRTVHFVKGLPKTPSGKVQRFMLRQGLPG
jgi:acetyl-CoA synthetase